MRRRLLLALLAAALAACTSPLHPPPADLPPATESAEAWYAQARARGEEVLKVDSAQSLVVLEVRRGGALARLGHDHVVASHDVSGFVAPGAGRADLSVPLEKLVVDEPALRDEAGFAPQPPADAIAGTRRNMLEKVLEASRYPLAQIRVMRPARDAKELDVAITLHGVTRRYKAPAEIVASADTITVGGRLKILQSDFGITPFSVLGGAMQVQDRLPLRFRIVAKKFR